MAILRVIDDKLVRLNKEDKEKLSKENKGCKAKLIPFKDIPKLLPQSIFKNGSYEIETQKAFVKLSTEGLALLSEMKLSQMELKVLFTILSHLTMTKNIKTKRYIGNGFAMKDNDYLNKTELAEELDKVDNKYLDTIIEKLEERELIIRVKHKGNTIYCVNPFIFMTGEEVDSGTFALFYKSGFNTYSQ